MRITGGEFRGRSITCPKGLAVRPTASKVRQAFFNILGDRLRDCRFLDLFSGTGLMGFEAASRGAAHVTFVEQNIASYKAIGESARNFGLSMSDVKVVNGDVLKVLNSAGNMQEAYDIIFVDPPYKLKLGPQVADLVCRNKLLNKSGLFIVEHMTDDPVQLSDDSLDLGLSRSDFRQYGQTALSFFSFAESNSIA